MAAPGDAVMVVWTYILGQVFGYWLLVTGNLLKLWYGVVGFCSMGAFLLSAGTKGEKRIPPSTLFSPERRAQIRLKSFLLSTCLNWRIVLRLLSQGVGVGLGFRFRSGAQIETGRAWGG